MMEIRYRSHGHAELCFAVWVPQHLQPLVVKHTHNDSLANECLRAMAPDYTVSLWKGSAEATIAAGWKKVADNLRKDLFGW